MSAPSLPLDPARIRAQFPSFSQPALDGWAFFDNAGGSYTCTQVLERLNGFYLNTKVQASSFNPVAKAAGEAMDNAYRRLAQAMNVGADWIHFGPSTSANTYTLAQAFAGWLKEGDAIVVTDQDHEANIGVWRKLAQRGIVVREWKVDPATGHLDPDALDPLLDSKVRAVCFPHVSNIIGEINPVAEIAKKAKSYGAVTVVDGVSYAPHGVPDLLQLGCDVYMFSAYKVFGPHQGVMAVRPSLAAELPNQSHFFNDTAPRKRLVPAGPDHAQVAAAAGMADYFEFVAGLVDTPATGASGPSAFHRAHDLMRAQEVALLAPLLDFVQNLDAVRLLGPTDAQKRAPTVSLVVPGLASEVAEKLGRHQIMAGGSHFYAWRLLEALGLDPNLGVLRLSFTHYTTPEEVTQLIAALDEVLG